MFSHTIVFVILSILSVTAAYAAGTPITKSPQEQHEVATEPKDSENSLQ